MNDKLREQNARVGEELECARPRWRRFDRIEDLDRTIGEAAGECVEEASETGVI
jgi:hypothetical protein